MTKTGKVELSNYQILKIVSWYNNNFKPSDSNKELPMKLRLNLQRNISALIDNAQSFEKVCREMWDDVQKGFLTDEKSREVKEMKKDESGEEKEIVNRVVKEEFREEYQQKNKEMSEKIEELSKETEIPLDYLIWMNLQTHYRKILFLALMIYLCSHSWMRTEKILFKISV